MSIKKVAQKALLTAAVAASVTGMTAATAQAAGKEKCFGVSKAGKNDCGALGLSCAGQSTKDNQLNAFIVLPKGLCERLTTGSLEPKADG